MKIILEEIYIFFYIDYEKFMYFEKFNFKKKILYIIMCEINHHLFIIFIFFITE